MYKYVKYILGLNIIRALFLTLFLFSIELVENTLPLLLGLYILSDVLLGIVFWKMSSFIYWFKRAAISFCGIVCAWIIICISLDYSRGWPLLLAYVLLCTATLIEKYTEFKGFEELICVDNYRLGRSWRLIRKWYLPFAAVLFVSWLYEFLLYDFPALSEINLLRIIFFIASSFWGPIGVFFIGIVKWIMFCRTIQLGKNLKKDVIEME